MPHHQIYSILHSFSHLLKRKNILPSANEILEVQVMDKLILKVIQIHKISEKSKKHKKRNEISEIKQKATELIKNIQIYSKLSTPSLYNKENEQRNGRTNESTQNMLAKV